MAAPDKFQHYSDSIDRAVKNATSSSSTSKTKKSKTTVTSTTTTASSVGGLGITNMSYPGTGPAAASTANYYPAPTAPPQNTYSQPQVNYNYGYPYPNPSGVNVNTLIASYTQQAGPLPAINLGIGLPAGYQAVPIAIHLPAPSLGVQQLVKQARKRNAKTTMAQNFVPVSAPAQSQPMSAAGDPPKTTPIYKVVPNPAVPPNWETSYNQAMHVIAPYSTTPVSNTSYEYEALAALVEPQFQIGSINRVVNPELWKKFTQTRKELMSRKLEDLEMLRKLGVPEREQLHRAHVIANFDKDASLVTDYSDNVALLFHGSRGAFDPILTQGLDERLGNAVGGLLGRGIYFADDPVKSMQYDANSTLMVFAVLLGDCLNVDNLNNRNTFVREPAKSKEQQRNHTDLFFDSITGRPAGVNEFVIYNRYQCCPLYTIAYTPTGSLVSDDRDIVQWRNSSPPFAWVPKGKKNNGVAMPPTNQVHWPFYAQTIFAQMELDEVKLDNSLVEDSVDSGNGNQASAPARDAEEEEESLVMKLSTLTEFGFTDDAKNVELLKSFGFDLAKTIDALFQEATAAQPIHQAAASSTSTSSTSSSTSAKSTTKKLKLTKPTRTSPRTHSQNTNGKSRPAAASNSRLNSASSTTSGSSMGSITEDAEEDKDCTICCSAFPDGASYWRELNCDHELCIACYKHLEKTGTTMSGVTHTCIKCPFCNSASGVQIGSCPDGTMTVTEMKGVTTPGNEPYSTYSINYLVPGQNGLNRVAYVPGSPEGLKVINLLKTAWDRRLCFVVGTSATTGAQNVLVWNIHHKTALNGGVQSYGFPDPTYLDRVQEELAAVGVA